MRAGGSEKRSGGVGLQLGLEGWKDLGGRKASGREAKVNKDVKAEMSRTGSRGTHGGPLPFSLGLIRSVRGQGENYLKGRCLISMGFLWKQTHKEAFE